MRRDCNCDFRVHTTFHPQPAAHPARSANPQVAQTVGSGLVTTRCPGICLRQTLITFSPVCLNVMSELEMAAENEGQFENQLTSLSEGDEVAVEYNSVHSDDVLDTRTETLTVTQVRVDEWANTNAVDVEVRFQTEDAERLADRRVTVMFWADGEDEEREAVTVDYESRNGGRWHKLATGDPEVTFEDGDEDDEDDEEVTEATTPEDARTLLRSLDEGDRVRFDGDEWKAISTDEDSALVEFNSVTGYHPGTTSLKPGSESFGAVCKSGRGMPTYYGRIERVVEEDEGDEEADADPDADDEPRLVTDGGTTAADGGSADVDAFDFGGAEAEDDEDALAFVVTSSWVNSYDDKKVAVETPAPWDTPDDMTPANEVVKGLEWDDHHYSFDSDREAWTLDATGLRPLKEAAEEAGYAWETRLGEDAGDNTPETFEALLDRVNEGDSVKVQYAKKNGNGLNTYAGRVITLTDLSGEFYQPQILFKDDGGQTKKVRLDDRGNPALYGGGHYPFMGEIVNVGVF